MVELLVTLNVTPPEVMDWLTGGIDVFGETVRVTVVGVVVLPSGEPVTMTVKGPTGVDAEVEIIKILEPVGVTGLVAKLQLTPVGNGVTHDKVTGAALPAFKVAIIRTVPKLPCTMLIGPLFDNE